jgi:uncharacterized protein
MGVISMVKCDYCNEEIDYLPFTCRYCGKSYCKKHRIPENHQCTFEFKTDPYRVKNLEKTQPTKIYTDYPAESQPKQTTSRKIRVRPPRIRDRTNRTRPQVTSLLGMHAKPYGTYGIMIVNAVFFIVSVFFAGTNSQYLYLSITDFISYRNYWTIITSIFLPVSYIPGGSSFGFDIFLGFIYLLIRLFVLFFIGRMVESRWGWKTMIWIYIISGLFSSIATVLIQWVFGLFVTGLLSPNIYYYSSWGATMGLIAFISMIAPQQQVTMYLYFIPIRMKMKNLLLLMIGINGIMGLFNLAFTFISTSPSLLFPQYFGGIAGVLGGLLILSLIKRRM